MRAVKALSPNCQSAWRKKLYYIIFESDTPAGKLFDLGLIAAIACSVGVVMLDSVSEYQQQYATLFFIFEWVFTLLFTVEYVLRVLCVEKPARYVLSFLGIIDLLAILPTYFSFFLPGVMYVVVIRVLRILRVFRILKLGAYLGEADILVQSLVASRKKIEVFVLTVLLLVIIFGSLMYLIEGEGNGFTSIPRSVYWAIVTLTTVGYGDIAPQTNLGQALASVIMIFGYGIIAVPTGIVSAEMVRASDMRKNSQRCSSCGETSHENQARFCKTCGHKLTEHQA